jgi:hypothetical protein
MLFCREVGLVGRLAHAQRTKLNDTNLQCMLQIPSIKMRTNLIRYMIVVYDHATTKLIIKETSGEISTRGVDVECIFGLENHDLGVVAY